MTLILAAATLSFVPCVVDRVLSLVSNINNCSSRLFLSLSLATFVSQLLSELQQLSTTLSVHLVCSHLHARKPHNARAPSSAPLGCPRWPFQCASRDPGSRFFIVCFQIIPHQGRWFYYTQEEGGSWHHCTKEQGRPDIQNRRQGSCCEEGLQALESRRAGRHLRTGKRSQGQRTDQAAQSQSSFSPQEQTAR